MKKLSTKQISFTAMFTALDICRKIFFKSRMALRREYQSW
jgi:hypothetical protein